MKRNTSDKALMRILELWDQGWSRDRILADFPEESSEEIQEHIALISGLQEEAMKIKPSRDVLRGALQRAAAEQERLSHPAPRAILAAAGFLRRIPIGVRLLAPALTAAFLVVLANGPAAVAPGQDSSVMTLNDAAPPLAAEDASRKGPAPDTALSVLDSGPPAAPSMAIMAAPPAQSRESQSASEMADSIADAYIAGAESEEKALSDTSEAQKAADADDRQSAQEVAEPAAVQN